MIYLLSIKNFKALVPLQLGVTNKHAANVGHSKPTEWSFVAAMYMEQSSTDEKILTLFCGVTLQRDVRKSTPSRTGGFFMQWNGTTQRLLNSLNTWII